MTRDQIKYSTAIMRNLKKHRDATPFLNPVDYVKLNVPDYPKVIKHPMDLNTVDRKLSSGEYENVEDFIADVRLVFSNCYKFNGPEAMISMLCQNVESAFEKSLRQMPLSREVRLDKRIVQESRRLTLYHDSHCHHVLVQCLTRMIIQGRKVWEEEDDHDHQHKV